MVSASQFPAGHGWPARRSIAQAIDLSCPSGGHAPPLGLKKCRKALLQEP
jgi:hypothetical protein